VLSGNGSDGSLGIAEVKSAYGMVVAQKAVKMRPSGV
jgi:chemotaxis response regulator CheB